MLVTTPTYSTMFTAAHNIKNKNLNSYPSYVHTFKSHNYSVALFLVARSIGNLQLIELSVSTPEISVTQGQMSSTKCKSLVRRSCSYHNYIQQGYLFCSPSSFRYYPRGVYPNTIIYNIPAQPVGVLLEICILIVTNSFE